MTQVVEEFIDSLKLENGKNSDTSYLDLRCANHWSEVRSFLPRYPSPPQGDGEFRERRLNTVLCLLRAPHGRRVTRYEWKKHLDTPGRGEESPYSLPMPNARVS